MNIDEAQKAINQAVDDHASDFAHNVGFWGYIMLPFEDSRGGSVLHFWPSENCKKKENIIFCGVQPYEHKSICGLSTEPNRRIVGHQDLYNVRKMRKCKRCLRRLTKLGRL